MTRIKRRTFIGMSALGAAGVVLPVGAVTAAMAPALARPRLLEILHDGAVVGELGRAYLDMVPAEDDAETLARAIVDRERGLKHRATVPAESEAVSQLKLVGGSLRAEIDERVRSDFAAGRTVTLKGWVLAVTEARQCALYALWFS